MKHQVSGLYYCQYLVGIGHLVRSLNICRSLVKKFEVDFLLGGHDVDLTIDSPHFHLLNLPPLGISHPYEDPSEFETVSKIQLVERLKYIEALTTPYSFLVTEIFPFSKWRFKEEIEALIVKLKTLNPDCLIACSLRDSFPSHPPEFDQQVLDFINRFYDVVFVHSDPRVYKLEESFSLADRLHDKVVYTGFIVRQDGDFQKNRRKKRIVVSLGSGSFGEELMYAVLNVAKFFPDYQFIFILGPKASETVHLELECLINNSTPNVKVIPFVDNFPEYLSQSALSISLGGYTIMDIVSTKTPAIVYPSTFYDQYVRALKFSGFGFLKIITKENLDPNSLKEVINSALHMPPSSFDIDMSGAETTMLELEQKLKK